MSGVTGGRAKDDTELVEAARGGDKDAFCQLVARHAPLARYLTERILGDPGLTQDTVQEATLQAYLSLARLRRSAGFGSWLCGIALNLARRCLRERRRLVLTEHAGELSYAQSLEDPYELVDIAALVREAVARLPAGQREATLLFYWQGLTQAEVAAELDISTGAVKNRLYQARAALTRPLAAAIHEQEEVPSMSTTTSPDWIEVSVAGVRRGGGEDPLSQPYVMLLRERVGDRTLPVWIGRFEATALALTLETEEMPRPMTYQFTANLLNAASTRIREVRITRLIDNAFYAQLTLDAPGGPSKVDARPSDAVNLALLTGAPITVAADVLQNALATNRTEWHAYPTTGEQLVSEVRLQREATCPQRDTP